MPTQKKIEKVAEIETNLGEYAGFFVVDYRGLTVEEDTALRKKFRESGVVYKVLKNTYIKRAADELGITGLDADLNGPTAVAARHGRHARRSQRAGVLPRGSCIRR